MTSPAKLKFTIYQGATFREYLDRQTIPYEVVADTCGNLTKVREAVDVVTGRPYEIMNMEKASLNGVHFNGNPGPLKLFVTGLERGKLRAWPMPAEDSVVELRVFRLPLARITDAGDQNLEIDEQHHNALLLWMKHLAFSKQDAETFDRGKADECEGRFRAYCHAALKEQERARRNSGTVVYGGL